MHSALFAQAQPIAPSSALPLITMAVVLLAAFFGIMFLILLLRCYRKVEQGKVLIRTGLGGTKVSFAGMIVLPVVHRLETMDISVKRVEIERMGANGLICKDNLRADVKVAFFVQVNKTPQDVLKVAQSLGCVRASDTAALVDLFDAKFSEGLKTVGKQFDFVELYTNRLVFKEQILKVIGTDLNGYVLDDAAIDYLEQTAVDKLDPRNILDADGIKRITELTARQAVLANQINRDKEKTIKKQDVETREAVLELERQQAEAEQNQRREIAEITARQQAQALKVQHEERLKAEKARIATEEEISVSEENKLRQIIVAAKNKQRTEGVETERVEKDRMLEATERERVVTLSQIEKEKAVEVERRNIQEVIRERVNVERSVVEQEEKIKDTREFAAADRAKKVALTKAEQEGEQEKIKLIKVAEADKGVSVLEAEQQIITAEGKRTASVKEADARKIIADASAQEEAIKGLGEARALEAKAVANEKYGTAEAVVTEKKALAAAKGLEAHAKAVEQQGLVDARVAEAKAQADAVGIHARAAAEASGNESKMLAQARGVEAQMLAEAKGQEAKADATQKLGFAEAEVMRQKYHSEATGIEEKAGAMKLFDSVGKDHEEFKLRLKKDLDVELAEINVQQEVARAQAQVIGEALKRARIDIVGGESQFFDKILSSITAGKVVDRAVGSSEVLGDLRRTLLSSTENGDLVRRLKGYVDELGIGSEDVKNLTIAALLAKMALMTKDESMLGVLEQLGSAARQVGIAGRNAASVLGAAGN